MPSPMPSPKSRLKKSVIFLTFAALAVSGVAVAQQSAQPFPPQIPEQRAEQRTDRMERRAARMEERSGRRLEKLKTDLKLTPAQETLWGPVQAQLRKMQSERGAFRQANRDRAGNAELPERLNMMADRTAQAAANMRALSGAVQPLWAALDETQKETIRRALPGRRGGRP